MNLALGINLLEQGQIVAVADRAISIAVNDDGV